MTDDHFRPRRFHFAVEVSKPAFAPPKAVGKPISSVGFGAKKWLRRRTLESRFQVETFAKNFRRNLKIFAGFSGPELELMTKGFVNEPLALELNGLFINW